MWSVYILVTPASTVWSSRVTASLLATNLGSNLRITGTVQSPTSTNITRSYTLMDLDPHLGLGGETLKKNVREFIKCRCIPALKEHWFRPALRPSLDPDPHQTNADPNDWWVGTWACWYIRECISTAAAIEEYVENTMFINFKTKLKNFLFSNSIYPS